MSSRNKPKYTSVRQDSFVFEGTNSRMIPSATAYALRRLSSEDRSSSGINQSSQNQQQQQQKQQGISDDMIPQIKINEITLFAQNYEGDWAKSKRIYKSIELVTYLLGLLVTLVSLLYSVCLLFYSRLKSIPSLFKLLDLQPVLAHSSLFYFIIEILSFVIYLTDLLRITRIWSCFKLEQRIKSKELVLKSTDIDFEPDSKISETIQNLKIRCAIRHKFVDILNPLIKLNTLISLYFLFFVFLPKYVISIWIQLNLASYNKQAEQALFDLFASNSSSNNDQVPIAVFQTLKCCYIKTNQSIFLYRNISLQECNLGPSSDCLNGLGNQLDFYVKLLISIFYSTATVNLFLKIISLFNFKYWLMHRLLFKSKSKEDDLCSQYNDSKSRIFRRQLESQIAENEKYWAENFLDLNLRKMANSNDEQTRTASAEPTAKKNGGNEENRYLNVEMEYFLNDDEKRAIEMIDDAIKKPTVAQPDSNVKSVFTFKTKK